MQWAEIIQAEHLKVKCGSLPFALSLLRFCLGRIREALVVLKREGRLGVRGGRFQFFFHLLYLFS